MTTTELLDKTYKIICLWQTCQIKKAEAEKELVKLVKEFDIQIKLKL